MFSNFITKQRDHDCTLVNEPEERKKSSRGGSQGGVSVCSVPPPEHLTPETRITNEESADSDVMCLSFRKQMSSLRSVESINKLKGNGSTRNLRSQYTLLKILQIVNIF